MRKQKCWILVLLSMLAAFSFCGCQAATAVTNREPQSMSGQGESLTLLHTFSEHQDLMKNLIAVLNESQEEFNLRLLCKDEEHAQEYVRTALASQSMTDLYAASASLMEDFLRQGGAKNLVIDVSERYHMNAARTYAREDGLFALPLFEDGAVLVANLDLLEENKLTVPGNREALQETLAQLVRNTIAVPMAVSSKPDGGALMRLRASVTDALLLENGCEDRDESDNWNGAVARGASVIKSWCQAGYFGSDFFSRSDEDAIGLFRDGQSPFLFCSTGETAALLRDDLGFELEIMAFPAEEGAGAKPSLDSSYAGIAVSSQSEAQYASSALLAFVEEAAKSKTALEAGWLPVEKGTIAVDVPAAVLWRLAQGIKQPDGALNSQEERSLEGQLFVEYLTSSMTADAFEKGFSAIKNER